MSRQSGPPSMFLVIVVVLMVLASSVGPLLAKKLRINLTVMGTELLPIALPVVAIIVVVLLIRAYWSSY